MLPQCCLEGPQRGPGPRALSAPALPRPVATSVHDDKYALLALTSSYVGANRGRGSCAGEAGGAAGTVTGGSRAQYRAFQSGSPLFPPPQLALPLTAPLHRPPNLLLTLCRELAFKLLPASSFTPIKLRPVPPPERPPTSARPPLPPASASAMYW